MQLTIFESQESTIVQIDDDRVDAAVAIHFREKMRDIVQNGGRRIILDLASVDFVDSSGLGAIIGALKQLRADQNLELAALQPAVSKVFKLTKMDSLFIIHPNSPVVPSDASANP